MVSSLPELSPEQTAILQDRAPKVVVNACPGSGKTRLFVARVISGIDRLGGTGAGVAALSFTNVAKDEIEQRLRHAGLSSGFPNFVGTLDSFLQRFIVQPFGPALGLVKGSGLELVPAEVVARKPGRPVKDMSLPKMQPPGVNQYEAVVMNGALAFRVDQKPQDLTFTDDATVDKIFSYKKRWWLQVGQVNHTDVRLLACLIFSDPEVGPAVIRTVHQRFPEILLDEAQDTCPLQEEAICHLLIQTDQRVFVVGDPDQGIFEFHGADGRMTDRVAKAVGISPRRLMKCFRSRQRICSLGQILSVSGNPMAPTASVPPGRAILVEHDIATDFIALADWQRSTLSADKSHAVLMQKNQEVSLARGQTRRECPIESELARALDRCSLRAVNGDWQAASKAAGIVLGELLLDTPTPNDVVLADAGIDRLKWRAALFSLVCGSMSSGTNETWDGWRLRMIDLLSSIGGNIGKSIDRLPGKLARRGDDLDKPRQVLVVPGSTPRWLPGSEILTVHQAKGREFDTVIFFCPKPHAKYSPCPSTLWFGNTTSEALERKRVAFVAATRAKEVVVLCLHRSTIKNMKQSGNAGFLDLFEHQMLP